MTRFPNTTENGDATLYSLVLPPDLRSPATARRWAAESLDRSLHRIPGETMDDVVLAVSELVTNATLHAVGPGCTLHVLVLPPDRIKVIVADTDTLHRAVPRVATGTDEDGRGLKIVARLAGCWGTFHDAVGKETWAQFFFTPEDPAPVASAPRQRPHLAPAAISR